MKDNKYWSQTARHLKGRKFTGQDKSLTSEINYHNMISNYKSISKIKSFIKQDVCKPPQLKQLITLVKMKWFIPIKTLRLIVKMTQL